MQEYIHCFYLCIISSINLIYSFGIMLTFKPFITPFLIISIIPKVYIHLSVYTCINPISGTSRECRLLIGYWGTTSPSLVQCMQIGKEYHLKWKWSLEGSPNLPSGTTRKRCSPCGLTKRAKAHSYCLHNEWPDEGFQRSAHQTTDYSLLRPHEERSRCGRLHLCCHKHAHQKWVMDHQRPELYARHCVYQQ